MGICTRGRANELETGAGWMCTTAAPVLTRVTVQHSLVCSHLPLSSSSEVNVDPLGSVTPLALPRITDTQADWMPPIHLLGSDIFF